jgi:uncharacterized protein YbjT (DUF2867 family)
MILITGATGKTGRHIIAALQRRGEPVRAMARSENVLELATDGVEAVQADMLDEAAVRAALDGVRAVVVIGPTFNTQEIAMGRSVINAAVATGVRRVVQLSVYSPQIETLVNHQSKLSTEDYVVKSGLEYTILQPMHFMQNYDPVKAAGLGRLRLPYTISEPRSYIDVADVAEVAAITLTEPGHLYAVYPLSGGELLSTEDVAALIAARAGVEISCEEVSVPEFVEWVSGPDGLPGYMVDGLHRLFTYYSRHPLLGNPNVLRWLLGREPTTFAQFVDRTLGEGTKEALPWAVATQRTD